MNQTILNKLKRVQLLILDIDGVLTNGLVYFSEQGEKSRGFHLQDGLGIKLLQKSGIAVAVISAKKTNDVLARLQELQVNHIYLGHEAKLPAYETVKAKTGLTDDVIAYMGDDLPDLPILRRVGCAITVPNANPIIKDMAHHITERPGGNGAVREVADAILQAQNRYQSVLDSYLNIK